jgi:hypothetical protein
MHLGLKDVAIVVLSALLTVAALDRMQVGGALEYMRKSCMDPATAEEIIRTSERLAAMNQVCLSSKTEGQKAILQELLGPSAAFPIPTRRRGKAAAKPVKPAATATAPPTPAQ